MSAPSILTPIHPEELLGSTHGEHCEFVRGRAVEKPMGAFASAVAGCLMGEIRRYLKSNPIGVAFDAECGYQSLPWDPTQLRRPDLSFVSEDRLPAGRIPDGYFPVAPDLAVEVVSPTDVWYEVEDKAREYLRAGTSVVWLISPNSRSVRVYRSENQEEYLSEEAVLSARDILPGFECPVAALFPPEHVVP